MLARPQLAKDLRKNLITHLLIFFPEHKYMAYTYDMGDYWVHKIRLLRVIEEHDKESPYLIEA